MQEQPRLTKRLIVALGFLAVIMSFLAEDWIAGLAIFVIWAIWHFLRAKEGPPVLAIALTFQWVQVTAGIFYYGLTGRRLLPMDYSDYRPMVLIGLGCVVSLLVGLRLGLFLGGKIRKPDEIKYRPQEAISERLLPSYYLAAIVLSGSAEVFAWTVPQLTQAILALTYIRFALLFLIFRRLVRPKLKLNWIALILLGEILLGATGFFAGFREAFIMAALALLEGFDQKKLRHWVAISTLAFFILLTGLMWTDVKGAYRKEFLTNDEFSESQMLRMEYITSASRQWFTKDSEELAGDLDNMVDRLWAIYYPALAVSSVPSRLPYENGAILSNAMWHVITPRLFFPEKAELESDSEMVRKYTGEWVAGEEQGTSIAFGYAAESYIDFGVPLMFIPVIIYGMICGLIYSWFLNVIQHRELAVSLVTVIFWLSLYLFERAWGFTLGLAGTLIIYLGGVALLLDRFLVARDARIAKRWSLTKLGRM